MLTHMSIFSGIGGGDLAFDRAGFTTVCVVEIDRQAQRVLRHHWPDALLLTDVTTVTPEHVHGLGRVNVVSFGSPCQDLSIAGRQAGIMGATAYAKIGDRHAHRVVAEQMLGRPLAPGEVVHHRDGNKRNFDPSNLEVLPSQAEHARLHFSKPRRKSS